MQNSILDRATADAFTQSLANVTHEKAFTVWDGQAYHPATQDDLDIYWYDMGALGAAIVGERGPAVIVDCTGTEPEDDDAPGEDCPEHGPYADDECPKCKA